MNVSPSFKDTNKRDNPPEGISECEPGGGVTWVEDNPLQQGVRWLQYVVVSDIITIFTVALGLAMDCFAVALGIGTTRHANSIRPIFRLSWHMGLFQGLMTLLGWLAGAELANWISPFDHWIAFGLLAYVGGRMVYSGFHPEHTSYTSDPSRGGLLLMLSVATSIDALAVGLSMGMLHLPVLLASIIIGTVSLVMVVIGLRFGSVLGERFGKRMEVFGGLLLIAIGLRIIITHLFQVSP